MIPLNSPILNLDIALANLGIKELNSMQREVLDHSLISREIIIISPTGSGKTLAILLPILRELQGDTGNIEAVIIVPTRELALQIDSVFRKIGSGFRSLCCYGGHDIDVEKRSLTEPPALLIGTPGRLADHVRRGNIFLNNVSMIVSDEFDKSLELGFHADFEEIFSQLPPSRLRVLTSATDSIEIPTFVGLSKPLLLNFKIESKAQRVTLKTVRTAEKYKAETLYRLLCEIGSSVGMVFCNHRERAEEITGFLKKRGVSCDFFHGGMDQNDRERVLCKFRNGSLSVLVTTDLASRGLDIPEVKVIIHYQLPDSETIFIHRNGRTARMGACGTVYLILTGSEELPAFIGTSEEFMLSDETPPPPISLWRTLYIGKGKKDKLGKKDIVGFLCQTGGLSPIDIGLIEIKDYHAFVAVKRNVIPALLREIKGKKIKGKSTKITLSQ